MEVVNVNLSSGVLSSTHIKLMNLNKDEESIDTRLNAHTTHYMHAETRDSDSKSVRDCH
jgi:gluconate kinase